MKSLPHMFFTFVIAMAAFVVALMSAIVAFFFSHSLFFLLLFIAGIVMVIFGLALVVHAIGTTWWPQTRATVEYVAVQRDYREDGTPYSLAIKYTYVVDGIEYSGDRLEMVEPKFSGRDRVERKVNRILSTMDQEKGINIRYHPTNHEWSIVIPGVTATLVAMEMFFILCALMFGCAWMAIK